MGEWSSPVHSSDEWCGSPSLLDRSYLLPKHYPFPPIRLVMDPEAGSNRSRRCGLYWDRSCRKFSAGREYEPDYTMREVVGSFLVGCHGRTCAALDLGANNGWITAYMLSLGANVTAVEPQADLARAAADSVTLNCWGNRGRVLHAFVDAAPDARGTRTVAHQCDDG